MPRYAHSKRGMIHAPNRYRRLKPFHDWTVLRNRNGSLCLHNATVTATPVADDEAGELPRESERRIAMTNKCAHPACSCPVSGKGMYCSAQCASGNPGNAMCGCKHPGCKATKTVDGQSS